MYIDTHAHIYFPQFQDDFDAVMQRFQSSGVVKIINVAVDLKSSHQCVDLADRYDDMYATCGVHPTEAEYFDVSHIDTMRNLIANHRKIVAIGEIGLDFFRNPDSRGLQEEVFRAQLCLARELALPVAVHCREAYEDALQILEKEKIEKAVFHCFAGNLSIAEKIWDCGFFTSFTGIVTYPNACDLHEVARHAPIDRCMVETDCPFLAPQRYRGQRNEPSFLPEIVRKIAELRNISVEQFSKVVYQNSLNFFKLN
jgi:TatD DNase family protein